MARQRYEKREDGTYVKITKKGKFQEEREISEADYEKEEFIDTLVGAISYIICFIIFLIIMGVFK